MEKTSKVVATAIRFQRFGECIDTSKRSHFLRSVEHGLGQFLGSMDASIFTLTRIECCDLQKLGNQSFSKLSCVVTKVDRDNRGGEYHD